MKSAWLGARTTLAKTLASVIKMLYGNRALGLYEEVPDAKFITPTALTSAVGLTAGTAMNAVSGWFKFSYKGKTLYVSKLPIRYGMLHGDLDAKGILTGQKAINIGGKLYRVRVLQGADSVAGYNALANGQSTTDAVTTRDTEFSNLMYRVSADGGYTGVESWIKNTLAQLGFTAYANGSATIAMERSPTLYNLFRGYETIKGAHKGDLSGIPPARGWRPCLELVEPMAFNGEVAQADLITSGALATAVGLSGGSVIAANVNVPWLKVTQDGITRYIAKKPFRNNLSWSALNALGIANGSKTIVIAGKTYKVRLLKGTQLNGTSVLPTSITGYDSPVSQYSEWNTVMYHLFGGVSADTKNTMASEGISVGDKAQYTEAQLGLGGSELGQWTLCQEPNSDTTAVCRGGFGISSISGATQTASSATFGWRPVLELVG